MKRNRIVALILSLIMAVSLIPTTAMAADPGQVRITIHYHREDGDYSQTNIQVWNFANGAANGGTVGSDSFGWTRTYTVADVEDTEYIKFQIASDSLFPTDVRYLDPAGKGNMEVWLIDGDPKAYGAPVKIAPEYTTARDGVRYIAVQALPVYFHDKSDTVNNFDVTSALSTGYNSPGLKPGSPAADGYGQVNGAKVTLLRNTSLNAAGTAFAGQDDWWEIIPESKQMLLNFAVASTQTNVANDAYAHAQNADGSELVLRHSDTSPSFQDIDVIQVGAITASPAGDGTGNYAGKTFLSIATIENMTLTLAGWVDGADTYLLPNIFVGYEKVIDVTGNDAAIAALGFSKEKLGWFKGFMETESASADGMAFAASITINGKRVFAEGVGTQAQFSTTPDGKGDYLAAEPIPAEDQIPVTSDTLFDLASNTKVWSTTVAFEHLMSTGAFEQYLIDHGVPADKRKGLDTRVVDLPGWENFYDGYYPGVGGPAGKDLITLRLLFTHRGGLPADPQYHSLTSAGATRYYHIDEDGDALATYDRTGLIEVICRTALNLVPGSQASGTYSDLDFMILGILIEQIVGMPLDAYVEGIYSSAFGIENTVYNPLQKEIGADEIAATCEVNGNTRDGRATYGFLPNGSRVSERNYTLKGEVHDEKAYYVLGGVAGHAGLFSTVNDMSELMQMALNNGSYNGYQFFTPEVHDTFLTQSNNTNVGWVGIGWWMNDTSARMQTRLNCGPSGKSYGHQGWTGTITVVDPVKSISIASFAMHKHAPTVNGETFSNTSVRQGGNNGFAGPGGEVLQNLFTFGSLDLIDRSQRTWEVTFDTNGSTAIDANGRPVVIGAQSVLDGNYVTEPVGVFSEDGLIRFAGWYLDAAGTTAWDFAADRVMEDITLYAKWTTESGSNDGHTVVFSHGGSKGIAAQKVAGGDAIGALPVPEKAGYAFDGWFTAPGGGGSAVTASTLVTSDMTLYAKWLKCYTVTYDTNGGSIVRHIYVAEGKAATDYWAGGSPYIPAKTSAISIAVTLEFMGWFTDEALTQAWDSTTPVTADLTVYAKWGPKTHSIKFDIRSGSTIPAIQAIADGGKVTQPSSPTKDNSVFEGWYTTAGQTTPVDFDAPIHENHVYYAKFTTNLGNQTVRLTAPAVGATPQTVVGGTGYTGTVVWTEADSGTPLVGTFQSGKEYTASVSLTSVPFPASTPMSFYRWPVTAPTVTIGSKTISDGQILGGNVTGNQLAFTVTYLPYTVTFDSNGGSDVAPVSVLSGETITPPAAPVKAWFTFGGWFSDRDLTVPWDFGVNTVTENITLYAKWIPVLPKTVADIRGSATGSLEAPVEYILSLEGMKKVLNASITFEVDGSMLEGKGFELLTSGFTALDLTDDHTGAIRWTNMGGGVWQGEILLMNFAADGFTSYAAVDIAKVIYNARQYGDATMKLTKLEVVGIDENDEVVYLDSEIRTAEATTSIVKVYSIYDLNKDGVVDALDLGIVQRYYQSTMSSDNWDAAKACDFNNDGCVDIKDLIELFRQYAR